MLAFIILKRLLHSIVLGPLIYLPLLVIIGSSLDSHAGNVTLGWDSNVEPDIAGYNVYYGVASRAYEGSTDVGNQTSHNLTGLVDGQTYYFAATAYNLQGMESDYSNEVTYTMPLPNAPPVANDASVAGTEDTPAVGTLNASDPDGDALNYTIVSNGSRGTVAVSDASTGAFIYSPNVNVFGVDSFSFKANDGAQDSNVAVVTVSIAPVNDAPMAVSDNAVTNEDTNIGVQVLLNDIDVDGDALSLQSVGPASNGVTTIQGSTVLYTPSTDFHGTDAFVYDVSDGYGGIARGSVSVTVNSVNDAPVANDGILTAEEGGPAGGLLGASDPDGDTLTYAISGSASNGVLALIDASTGAYTYTPAEGVAEFDAFTFTVNDGTAYSNVATVSITIVPAEADAFVEVGEITIDHDWTWVGFRESFVDPIVVAKPASYNDSDPCVVRIRNVDAMGFEIRIQEWDYMDGSHGPETVSYIAMESGPHELPDGILVEAGRFEMWMEKSFEPIAFTQPFNVTPVVIAAVSTVHEQDAVIERLNRISRTGFEFRMQEQQANRIGHEPETINYIAWEPSSGVTGTLAFEIKSAGEKFTHKWRTVLFLENFQSSPMMLARYADDKS